MKHYKSVGFLSILECQASPHKPKAPPQKRKAPPIENFRRRFWTDTDSSFISLNHFSNIHPTSQSVETDLAT